METSRWFKVLWCYSILNQVHGVQSREWKKLSREVLQPWHAGANGSMYSGDVKHEQLIHMALSQSSTDGINRFWKSWKQPVNHSSHFLQLVKSHWKQIKHAFLLTVNAIVFKLQQHQYGKHSVTLQESTQLLRNCSLLLASTSLLQSPKKNNIYAHICVCKR